MGWGCPDLNRTAVNVSWDEQPRSGAGRAVRVCEVGHNAYNAVMIIVLFLAAALAMDQSALTKTLTDDVTGITTIVVDASVADLRLVSGTDARLRTQVVLDSRDASRLSQCARSELRSRRDGTTLRVTLSQPGREHCHEAWSVEIPGGIAVEATVDVGSIDATLTGRYGNVDVHAAVGKARLELNGHRLSTTRRHGPSEYIRVEGDGARVALRSKVGNVTAVVKTPG